MKKYITVAALLAAGTAFANAADTSFVKHGVKFNVDTTGKAYQNQTPAKNYLFVDDGKSWGNGTTILGLYVDSDAGITFNTGGSDVTVSYLYLAPGLTVKNGDTANTKRLVTFNVAGGNFIISSSEGSWADIDGDYGSLIDVSAMTSGAIYLNTNGALTVSSLNEDVAIFATFTADEFVGNYSRKLLTGDFSEWEGTVNVLDASGKAIDLALYNIERTNDGLFVSAATIPEPSAFGLLAGIGALALVASRRRRK